MNDGSDSFRDVASPRPGQAEGEDATASDPFDVLTGDVPAAGRPVTDPSGAPSGNSRWQRSFRSKVAGSNKRGRSDRPLMPMKASLRLGAVPPWEPAYSVLQRLADRNGSSTTGIAKYYGLDAHAILDGDPSAVEQLALVADADPASVRRATAIFRGKGGWYLRDERLGRRFFERGRRVCCRSCLEDDRVEGFQPPHLAISRRVWWDIRPLHHCPIHRCRLDRLDQTGRILREATTEPAEEADCALEAYILGRLGFHDRMTSDLLDQLSIEAGLELVAACGALTVHGPAFRTRIADLVDDVDLFKTGFEIARSSEGFVDLLRSTWSRADRSERGWSPTKLFGLLYMVLDERHGAPKAAAVRLVQQFVRDTIPRSDRLMVLGSRSAGPKLRPARYSDADLDVGPKRVLRVGRSLGLLGTEVDPSAKTGISAEASGRIVDLLKTTIGSNELRRGLGLLSWHLKMIVDAGLIEPVHQIAGVTAHKYLFARNAADEFMARLTRGAPIRDQADADWVTVFRAGRARLSFTYVLTALAEGRLEAKCRLRGVKGLTSIRVSMSDVRELRGALERPAGMVSVEESASRLGFSPAVVKRLLFAGVVKNSIKVSGRGYWIPETELRVFDSSYVAGSKLSRVLGVGANRVGMLLSNDYGVECAFPEIRKEISLYRRSDVVGAGLPVPDLIEEASE